MSRTPAGRNARYRAHRAGVASATSRSINAVGSTWEYTFMCNVLVSACTCNYRTHQGERPWQDLTETRFTALPDEETLAATTVTLEEHGFSVEVVDDLDAAPRAVLERIPTGASVMTNTSVTLEETGIAEAINGGGVEVLRNQLLALDYATQRREMRAVGGQADFALGSVHAVTSEGTLLVASASGSQLGQYAWGADQVIFVVGAQKLVPTVEAGRERTSSTRCPSRTCARPLPTG